MTVAYQGVPGAFGHAACLQFVPDHTPVAKPNFTAVLAAVASGSERASGLRPRFSRSAFSRSTRASANASRAGKAPAAGPSVRAAAVPASTVDVATIAAAMARRRSDQTRDHSGERSMAPP